MNQLLDNRLSLNIPLSHDFLRTRAALLHNSFCEVWTSKVQTSMSLDSGCGESLNRPHIEFRQFALEQKSIWDNWASVQLSLIWNYLNSRILTNMFTYPLFLLWDLWEIFSSHLAIPLLYGRILGGLDVKSNFCFGMPVSRELCVLFTPVVLAFSGSL